MRQSLGGSLAAAGCVGAQPQRGVFGLHGLPHHAHHLVAQPTEVRLVAQLGREGFERLGGVVLAAVKLCKPPFYAVESIDLSKTRGASAGNIRLKTESKSKELER